MAETFLININCSKILGSGETQYTMLIDSTKISIVYELVEWIRWMFSVEGCFYLTHENSVVHELEDIQLLSRLKNLEIKPCGQSHCVHKKIYRTLLSSLNFFACWNKINVPKYFLDKVSRMDQKLASENHTANRHIMSSSVVTEVKAFSENKSVYSDENKKNNSKNIEIFPFQNHLQQSSDLSSTEVNSFDKITKPTDSINCGNNFNNILNENISLELNKSVSFKNKQGSNKKYAKSSSGRSSNKFVKPFTLGETLSNLREDFVKKKSEMTLIPSYNFSPSELNNISENMTFVSNFLSEDKITRNKKKQRTRRRKKSKKENEQNESFIPYFSESGNAILGNVSTSELNTNLKANHIRFNFDDESNSFETDCIKDEPNDQNENKFEITSEKSNYSDSTVLKVGPEKLKINYDSSQTVSYLPALNNFENSTDNKMDYSASDNEYKNELNLISLKDEELNSTNHSNKPPENLELNSFNQDLGILLSLKEKLKSAVVVKRFY